MSAKVSGQSSQYRELVAELLRCAFRWLGGQGKKQQENSSVAPYVAELWLDISVEHLGSVRVRK